jgi:uncharacterized protein
MKCPKCNIFLVVAEKKGIEIDFCPQCRGVWVDRGEFDKLIANSDEAQSITSKRKNDENRAYKRGFNVPVIGPFDEYANRGKKKKSMLDNLFDFCMR